MAKFVYVAAPFSAIEDKAKLMKAISAFCGNYMISNPGEYAITGLLHYYAVVECPELGNDYKFWKESCEMLMSKSDQVIVLQFPGWDTSIGVIAEIDYATDLGIPITYQQM